VVEDIFMGGVLIYCEDSLFKFKVKNGTIDKQNKLLILGIAKVLN